MRRGWTFLLIELFISPLGFPGELREHPDNLQSTAHNGLLARV